MYIKCEASKGSSLFVENNDLKCSYLKYKIIINKLKMFKSLWKKSYNTLPYGPFDSKYLVFACFCHYFLVYFISY